MKFARSAQGFIFAAIVLVVLAILIVQTGFLLPGNRVD
jgi:hypothetical protein